MTDMRDWMLRVALGGLAWAGAALGAPATGPAPVFCIGTPDGSALEFGLVAERWPGYQAAYPQPIVFTVGRDKARAWPYIHPSRLDIWAGGRDHTFTIRFELPAVPAGPLHLCVGQVESLKNPLLTVACNGREFGSRRVPEGSGAGDGNPGSAGRPAAMVFPVPPEALRAGANELTLELSDGSWIIYDYVLLGPSATPPRTNEDEADLRERVQAALGGGATEIVFAVRSILHEHWYANFSYFAPDSNRKAYGKAGRLCRLNLKTGQVTELLADPEGSIRDPAVDYDGRRIVFAWRKGGTESYHLHTIQSDGSGLRQITDGPYDDFEPCWLPDGGITFVSSRCRRWVNCWLTQVAVIHRCEADGSGLRQLSANVEHDNTPWVLPDGRLLYMRWEYVDRSQVHYHHLWTMNPDGTGQAVYFGNLHPGDVYIDAKPIPGSQRVVLIKSPGHGQTEHMGHLATVSQRRGPDALAELVTISGSGSCRDPWALSPDLFLAADGRRLDAYNARGRRVTLHELAGVTDNVWLHEPRPLAARPRETAIPPRVNLAQRTGRFFLSDVTFGRNMAGVQRGEVKKLLVMESLPKPINFTGGMDPLSYAGTFTLERILGTVPVAADGSAYFEAPATRSLFFIALDANDLAIKRMQSFTSVAPGETLGCVGCHEHRALTQPMDGGKRRPLALAGGPSPIEPVAGAPDVLDFPRDVQPILDRHCLRCHNADKRSGGVCLSGDRGPMFSLAYYALTVNGQLADGRNLPRSNYGPRQLGSGGAPLLRKLDGAHHDVRLTPAERTVVRLWIEACAPYPGTYAALGCGMIGGYQQNEPVLNPDFQWPETKAAQAAFDRRCAACHTAKSRPLPRALSDENGLSFWQPSMDDPRLGRTRHVVFNLTRPELSLYLRAPLAKAAGGLGVCRPVDAPAGTEGAIFKGPDDADYLALRGMVEAGQRRLDTIKRFDMPGFRPRLEWVREMKRYGILPATFDPAADPIDVYAVERQYWDALGYGQ